MTSEAPLITGQILQRYLPMIRLPVWEYTQPPSTDAVISTSFYSLWIDADLDIKFRKFLYGKIQWRILV
jgi:hypothetical protein